MISPEGRYLDLIPTPRGVITTAFGGKDKKTLFIPARGVKDASGAEVANAAQVWSIQTIAQGFQGRAKQRHAIIAGCRLRSTRCSA